MVVKAQDSAHEVAEQVQTAAQETVQKMEHVAQEARDAAQRTAQQEGLLPYRGEDCGRNASLLYPLYRGAHDFAVVLSTPVVFLPLAQ